MKHPTRIKVAALATALFFGGLVAAGLGLRSGTGEQATAAKAKPAEEIVRETTVRREAPSPESPTTIPAASSGSRTPAVMPASSVVTAAPHEPDDREQSDDADHGGREPQEREHEVEHEYEHD